MKPLRPRDSGVKCEPHPSSTKALRPSALVNHCKNSAHDGNINRHLPGSKAISAVEVDRNRLPLLIAYFVDQITKKPKDTFITSRPRNNANSVRLSSNSD